jgi:hypothetical protein
MFLKNSRELLTSSYLVNPQPYIKRVLLFSRLKKEKSAFLYYFQKGLCPICSQKLIDDVLHDITIQYIIYGFPLESYMFNRKEVCIFKKKNREFLSLDYILKSNWDVNLMLDHIIPKELAPQNS